jgi:hypothetical protein
MRTPFLFFVWSLSKGKLYLGKLKNTYEDIKQKAVTTYNSLKNPETSTYTPTTIGGKRRKTRKVRKGRKQRGGTVFSEEQLTELGRLGFNDEQKKILARGFSITPPNMAMESIRQALQHNCCKTNSALLEGGDKHYTFHRASSHLGPYRPQEEAMVAARFSD